MLGAISSLNYCYRHSYHLAVQIRRHISRTESAIQVPHSMVAISMGAQGYQPQADSKHLEEAAATQLACA